MRALIATLLLFIASPVLAFQGMGPGPGVKGYGSSKTPIITQDVDDGGSVPADTSTYSIGQSFTMPTGETAIKSIELYVHQTGTDVTLMVDSDYNFSNGVLGSVTKSISSTGYNEFVFNITGLTSGQTYYFGIAGSSTTTAFRRATEDVYDSGTYRYSSYATNIEDSLIGHEFRFIINK
jgi:hypothetical protein